MYTCPNWKCRFKYCSNIKSVLNSLPDKILDLSKLKAFADDKIIETQKLKIKLRRVENIVRKGENTGFQHFLFFPQCFQKASYSGLRSRDCVVKNLQSKKHCGKRRKCLLPAFYPIFHNVIKGFYRRLVNPFPNKRGFKVSAGQVFWKHREKKKKLLVTSNFSFSHSVFCPFG